MADQRLIVALDTTDRARVEALVGELGELVGYYKVGMELFYSQGPDIVRCLRQQGKEVFLDLKLHDIPNTVAQALRPLVGLGATMLNLHASGGTKMMKAAATALREEAKLRNVPCPKLIAVTVLTSMDATEWESLGCVREIAQQVSELAKMAQAAGLDGVVASSQEAALIRKACGDSFAIVTPGIRPAGSATDDQARILTPREAIEAGADYLVVGRPITAALEPRKVAEDILRQMKEGKL
ncbi:orotidine-5'-phosphate decarboxylase [Azotosporobacter soli]|uniref:orotidine-5'-phosphate decarboxylase n=1 Tax=Azotosporobacter soli TaxID=3055040 RepID=UPI0031FE6260